MRLSTDGSCASKRQTSALSSWQPECRQTVRNDALPDCAAASGLSSGRSMLRRAHRIGAKGGLENHGEVLDFGRLPMYCLPSPGRPATGGRRTPSMCICRQELVRCGVRQTAEVLLDAAWGTHWVRLG